MTESEAEKSRFRYYLPYIWFCGCTGSVISITGNYVLALVMAVAGVVLGAILGELDYRRGGGGNG